MRRIGFQGAKLILLTVGVMCALQLQAHGYNHPELNWRTFETEHFLIHYHEGVERTAGKAAQIAEEIYGPVTSLYDYEFEDKIHLIFRDDDDYANGITYYYDHKIVIWATSMDYELRGTSDWLWNVITHEFTHMVSLNAARKIYRQIPAFYFQYIDYQEEKRPDVFIGYPNRLVSYPFAMTVVPMWFAEGMAQCQAPSCSYDCWDSHRDMILRMAVLEGNMLSYDEMCVFGKSGLGNEQVYDHGYGLARYILDAYGPESLGKICRAMRPLHRINFDGATKRVLGKTGEDLYQEWVVKMRDTYEAVRRERGEPQIEGEMLTTTDDGYLNIHPCWSPDGKSLVYLSNRGSDYSALGLYLLTFPDRHAQKITGGISSPPSWSSDGTEIVYSKRNRPNRHGSRFNDLYIYTIGERRQKRISRDLRAKDPAFSADGRQIVFVSNSDGSNNLGIMNVDGSDIRYITNSDDGTQYYNPQWSPDGQRIVFSESKGTHRNIAMIAPDGSDFRYLVVSPGDDRDPCWTPDGKEIIFSSDIDGIFNLYSYSLENEQFSRLTNVLGGAFMPSYSSKKQISYASYSSKGYSLVVFADTFERHEVAFAQYDPSEVAECVPNPGDPVDVTSVSEPYKMTFSSFFIYPRIAVDYGTLKGGFYFSNGDILEKQSLFAGAQMNRDKDLDLFILYEVRQFAPTLFLEFYKQTRHEKIAGIDSFYYEDQDYQTRLVEYLDQERSFNLNEANVGLRHNLNILPLFSNNQEVSFTARYSSYAGDYQAIAKNYVHPDTAEAFVDFFKYTYFKGFDFILSWKDRFLNGTFDEEINPSAGHNIELTYARLYHKFLDPENPFKLGTFGIQWIYRNYFYNRLTLDWEQYIPMPLDRHTLTAKLRAGIIRAGILDDPEIDDFFNFFVGAIDGLRGYSYYSIEGKKMLLGRLTYRFPIFKSMGKQLLHLHFDKLYGAVFADAGNAWNGDKLDLWEFKKDVGAELRLETYSFYTYPTRVFFQAAYGFDRIVKEERVNGNVLRDVISEPGWRCYFGVLFGFL
ncbi:MAG: PD40 domain-containing protein [Gemmatimonadota bacterium]|nr:MAG: PD40 domain-containing protein [Gemmatimonadota bacterium]